MLGETFKSYVQRLVEDWLVQEDYRSRAYEAIEFQYTYWPDPENSSARTQEFINVSITTGPIMRAARPERGSFLIDEYLRRAGYT